MAQVIDINDDFPTNFYKELARIAVAFGRIEYLIKLCIKSLKSQGFTAGMIEAESTRQFSTLCDEAKKQANAALPPAKAKTFCDLIDGAKDLADYRNDTIHAAWTTEVSSGQPYRIRPKWDKSTKSVDWTRGGPTSMSALSTKRKEMEQLLRRLTQERNTW